MSEGEEFVLGRASASAATEAADYVRGQSTNSRHLKMAVGVGEMPAPQDCGDKQKAQLRRGDRLVSP